MGLSAKNLISIFLLLIAIGFFGIYVVSSSVFQPKAKLEYKMLSPEYIVSAAYKTYGNEKLGMWATKTIATNAGDAPIYNLKFHYKIDTYSDWVDSNTYEVLLPNSTVVNLYYPILSSEVTKLTTSTPSRLSFKATYRESPDGPEKEMTTSKPITLLGAHDIIYSSIPPEENTGSFYDMFDNYPLIAAWVTPTDPILMRYADLGNKLAGGAGADLSDEGAIKSLAGMWELSVMNNIQYKTEPSAYWTGKFSQYLKYPRDVIRDRIGTCIDTSIFFASLAASQGLKAYIMLIPGHAFPVIVLPQSGNLIPIESTLLNQQVSFEEAVQGGAQSWETALAGPHILIDVEEFQSQGITPPELETLPPDTLESWGVVGTTQQQQGNGGNDNSGNTGNTGTTTNTGTATYSNRVPKWHVKYPASWSKTQLDSGMDLFSSDKSGEFLVLWSRGMTKAQAQNALESILRSSMDRFVKKYDGTEDFAGTLALTGSYLASTGGADYIANAKYFEYDDYGFAVLCDYEESDPSGNRLCNSMFQTFVLGS